MRKKSESLWLPPFCAETTPRFAVSVPRPFVPFIFSDFDSMYGALLRFPFKDYQGFFCSASRRFGCFNPFRNPPPPLSGVQDPFLSVRDWTASGSLSVPMEPSPTLFLRAALFLQTSSFQALCRRTFPSFLSSMKRLDLVQALLPRRQRIFLSLSWVKRIVWKVSSTRLMCTRWSFFPPGDSDRLPLFLPFNGLMGVCSFFLTIRAVRLTQDPVNFSPFSV